MGLTVRVVPPTPGKKPEFAYWYSNIARRKGRDVPRWAILGFPFPLVALIIISLPSSKAPQLPPNRRSSATDALVR